MDGAGVALPLGDVDGRTGHEGTDKRRGRRGGGGGGGDGAGTRMPSEERRLTQRCTVG